MAATFTFDLLAESYAESLGFWIEVLNTEIHRDSWNQKPAAATVDKLWTEVENIDRRVPQQQFYDQVRLIVEQRFDGENVTFGAAHNRQTAERLLAE